MSSNDADIIVIGSGSAGSAMAGRLSEDPGILVLVLEAGRSDRHPYTRIPAANVNAVQNPAFDWCMQAEPDPSINNRIETWAAAKVVGGGSAINGMMFIRGHRWDYDHWASIGASGWDYVSVLPFFKEMETNEAGPSDFRGGCGPLRVSENRAPYPVTQDWIAAAAQAGIPRCVDLNGERCEGVDRVQVSQRRGWRHSSAAAFLHSNLRRPNLRLETKAQVLRILFKNRRAVGVEVAQNGQLRRISARAGVVVCCGTVNSARLLMVSGVGPAADLLAHGVPVIHDLPGVGANLQDHVGTHLINRIEGSTLNVETQGLPGLRHMINFFLRGRGALTTAIGHAQAFIATRDGVPAPNIQLSFLPFAFGLDAQGKIKLLEEPAISTMVAVMRPQSRGRVTLRSADLRAPPVIRHQLLGVPDDLEQLMEGLSAARRIIQQPALAPYRPRELAPGPGAGTTSSELCEYVRSRAISMYHPVGTCKMGTDSSSVVSAGLAVHGTEGLWVADASVMPALPSGNTNATAIMIGYKGAHHVRGALKAVHPT